LEKIKPYQSLRGRLGETVGEEFMASEVPDLPSGVFYSLAQKAAGMCTVLIRGFIKSNMRQAGIDSIELAKGIDAARAFYGGKKGAVIFRMTAGLKRGKGHSKKSDPRPEALYVQAASLDAGWVTSPNRIGASAKRRIKAGVADWKTTRAVRQIHNGRLVERAAFDLGSAKVHVGRPFWFLHQGQQTQVTLEFRKHFFRLATEYKAKQ
jgi:hypothetical protein